MDYRFDDGESFDYKKGVRSHLRFRAELKGKRLLVSCETLASGYGPCRIRVVVYARPAGFSFSGDGRTSSPPLAPYTWTAGGAPLKAFASPRLGCGKR